MVGAAVLIGAWLVARAGGAGASQPDASRTRHLQIVALFAPGMAAVAEDPRALLVWQPLAATARALFPEDFAAIDRAAGAMFPFTREQVEAAHARWSTEWLAWEQTHDAECKLKA